MASISSAGIGSGLDVRNLVGQLVQAEGEAPKLRLDKQEAQVQAQLSALGSFKGALSSFQLSLGTLSQESTFAQRSVTSGNEDLFTATSNSSSVAANYQIDVQSLAKAHKLVSSPIADSSSAIGTGSLTFQFGDPTLPAQTVEISAENNSLEGIRDAVNAAKIGVGASIVNGDSGYQLVFSSNKTGSDNSLKITVAEDGASPSNTDMSGLSQLAYDPAAAVGAGKNMTESAAATDAQIKVDGVLVTRSTNTITDAIEGITLSLKKEDPGNTTSLSITHDRDAARSAISGFVDNYNKLVDSIKTVSGYNADTQRGGVLLGDSTVRGIDNQLRRILGNVVDGLDGKYQALADLGVATQSDGKLKLDEVKLNQALDDSFDDIGRIFAALGRPTDSLINYSGSTSDTQVGEYAVNITQLATRGSYAGGSIVDANIVSGVNDSFSIKVDGLQSGTINITPGDYSGTKADLAAELQSRINGDSALQDAGKRVIVSYDGAGDSFTIQSERYGSASKIEIMTDHADLGFTATTGTDGLDVAGTIGGVEATGSGQLLTSAEGDSKGLKLSITGETLGDRGTVNFTRGVADRLDSLLDNILSFDAVLSSRTEGLTRRLDDIDAQRDTLELRLQSIQSRYMKQFVALDALIGTMQQTSSFLTQQLAGLPGAGGGSDR